MTKRFDIIAHDNYGKPNLLVECKAPNIIINQKSFDQIIGYNKVIDAKYLMLTNGIRHICRYSVRFKENFSNIRLISLTRGLL